MDNEQDNQNNNLEINTYSAESGSANSGNVSSLKFETNARKELQLQKDRKERNRKLRTAKEVIGIVLFLPLILYASLYIWFFLFVVIVVLFIGFFWLTIWGYNPFVNIQTKSIFIALAILVTLFVAYKLLINSFT